MLMMCYNSVIRLHYLQKTHIIAVFKFILVITVISILLELAGPLLNSPQVHDLAVKYELLGALLLVMYMVLSQIVAPVSGSPVLFIGLAFFGPYKTVIYIYLAELISATVNFYISRRFGRAMVVKMVGKDTIQDIDASISRASFPALILARLFGFSIFEIVSYVFGLTNMQFKKYFLTTAFIAWIPNFVLIYFMRSFDFTSARDLIIYYVSTLITGGAFVVLIKLSLRNIKYNSKENYK